MKPSSSSCLLFIIFLSIPPSILCDPRISQAGLFCGTSKPKTPLSSHNFIPIFVQEMQSLSQTITSSHTNFASHSLNLSSLPIFALAHCFHDLSHTDCLLCYSASRTKLPRCLPSLSARIYLDGCFLRYDNYNFYSQAIDPSTDTLNCSSSYGVVEGGEFERSVGEVVDNVVEVSVGKGFGVGEVGGVFALGQCWGTLRSEECEVCLRKAAKDVRGCLPNKEGRALNAGCYLRYSTHKFYNEAGDDEGKDEKGSLRRGVIIAIVLSVAAVLLLFLSALYLVFTRLSNVNKGSNHLGQISISINKSSLNFKYETLEKATDYFNASRKIGQGGAGSVYKGTLPNGKVVAVKRLVYNTRQWVDEFFNEVNLISGIEHKNLVKLLGCSIEGPESLLVYEYLPNKSLDHFIFENKSQILNWKQRFDIIMGTAEGLAYLHAGSNIRIIHRDIKSSNILLDENLTPKIADFGLARCFASDQTHLSTGIAGTLGYMAPEYLVRGQLTEKADVYSFGVLVLEILCGRRNNVFREDSGSLLQTTWKLYQTNRLHEAVDPCLGDDFPEEELSRVLQIGLSCTQASAPLRPTMEKVVELLSDSNVDVCVPNQPPFLSTTGNGLLNSDSSIRSCSTNSSFVSNALKKIGISQVSSSETFGTRSSEGPSRSEEQINQT